MSPPNPVEDHSDLKEIIEAVKELPIELQVAISGHLTSLSNKLIQRDGILLLVREALDQMRLDVNYLVFDLVATRRERDAYKKELGK